MGPYDEQTHALFDDDHALQTRTLDTGGNLDAQTERWVASARSFFATVLGRQVGSDDRAAFVWKQHSCGQQKTSSPSSQLVATWRSVGKDTHQLAAAIRRNNRGTGAARPISTHFWRLHQRAWRLFQPSDEQPAQEEQAKWLKYSFLLKHVTNTLREAFCR